MSLHQVLTILWARKWIILIALASSIAAAVAAVMLLPPKYKAETSVIMDSLEPDPVTGRTVPSPLLRNHQRTQTTLLRSDQVALEVVDDLQLADDPRYRSAFMEATEGQGDIRQWIANQLQENLNAYFINGSNVMQITFTASSPDLAAVLANTFKSTYLQENLDLKVGPAQRNAEWFDNQIEDLSQSLDEARERLIAFQRENELLMQREGEDNVESAKLMALTERLMEARGQLLAAQNPGMSAVQPGTTGADGSAASGTVPPAPNAGGQAASPALTALQSRLAEVEARIGSLSSRLGPNNPEMQSLFASRASLERRIEEEQANMGEQSAAQADRLRALIADLEDQIREQQGRMLDMQGGQEELAALSREVQVRENRLNQAQERAAALRMQGQQSFVNVVSLDEATPPRNPDFPNKPLALVLAAGFGLGLGVILALFIEMLDRRVRTAADLENAVGMKPLGSLASAKAPRKLLPRKKGRGASPSGFTTAEAGG